MGDPLSYQIGPLALPKGKFVASGTSPQDATDETRSNAGFYADVESDITNRLLVAAALRHENYTDFGSNVSGKLVARVKLTDMFSVRSTRVSALRRCNRFT